MQSKKVKDYYKAKDIRFATEQEVLDLTNGVQIGAVPPFGNRFNLEVLVDPKLLKNEKIVFNAGDRSFSIAMKSEDYKKLVNPKIVDITSQIINSKRFLQSTRERTMRNSIVTLE